MSITTAQIRGARGILNWSQGDLADRTGISPTSIGNIEKGLSQARESTLTAIQKSFEDSGIEFLGKDGVRIKTGEVRVFTGREGYLEFFEDVYQTLNIEGGDVYVSNVDERKFVKWHGEMADYHLHKMTSLRNKVKYKILIQEGDTYYPALDYSEYRWIPSQHFTTVPFYVYGKKLGIILFENEPTIILLEYPAVAQAYRLQFEAMWKESSLPKKKEQDFS